MKIITATMLVLLAAIPVLAKDFEIKSCGDECKEIHTRGGPIYRVYACGKLEKLTQEWKELNPNEELLTDIDRSKFMPITYWDGVACLKQKGDGTWGWENCTEQERGNYEEQLYKVLRQTRHP